MAPVRQSMRFHVGSNGAFDSRKWPPPSETQTEVDDKQAEEVNGAVQGSPPSAPNDLHARRSNGCPYASCTLERPPAPFAGRLQTEG